MKHGFDRPEWTHQYRAETATQKPMSGVSSTYTFLCKKCNQSKRIAGRKKLKGEGFQCAECAAGQG